MKILKTLPIVAASAALGLGFSGGAQADAYAVSFANVTDFNVSTNPFVGIVPATGTAQASAALNGNGVSDSGSPNALAVTAPGSNAAATRADNVFNQFGIANANYSNADASIDQEQVTPAGTTQTRQIGESYVAGNASATTTQTENGSTTLFVLSLQQATQVSFSFNAYKYLQVALSANSIVPGTDARATIDAEIVITSGGVEVFTWRPDGSLLTGITGGTESADAFDMNQVLPASFPGDNFSSTPSGVGCAVDTIAANNGVGTAVGNACFGSFAATTNVLNAGNYSLALSIKTSTNVNSVPEPGTLGLLAMGLLGLGGLARRKKMS